MQQAIWYLQCRVANFLARVTKLKSVHMKLKILKKKGRTVITDQWGRKY